MLDTSSLFMPRLRRSLHAAAVAQLYTGMWSPWVIAELNRVLTWDWVRRGRGSERACSQAAKTMMELLLPAFELVNPLPPYPVAWQELDDVWDMPVWAAAVTAGATHIVSENTRDFPAVDAIGRHRYHGIEYVRGDQFLAILGIGPD